MHDLEFDHLHYIPDDEVNEVAWATDNVELRTVGIDIGSSTSHLMFSLVHLQRLGTALSSRFVVIKRQVMWQSPIKLTPYLPDYTIDTDDLAEFFGGCYHLAQVDPDDVDSGAVILTGEAIKRHNARAIAELFSEVSGTFVCASAGHHMECQMAAHGSGAVAMSRGNANTVLNVDIGGGTTKLALIENGEILATIAIAVGGRLIVEDKTGMTRIEEPVRDVARSLGIDLALGQALAPQDRERIVERMVRQLMRMIDRRPPDELSQRLLVTEPWPAALANKTVDAITFSGGVAEYLYKRETAEFRRPRLRPLGSAAAHAGAPQGSAAGLGPGTGHPRHRDRRRAVLGAGLRQHHPDHQAGRPADPEPAGDRLHVRYARRRSIPPPSPQRCARGSAAPTSRKARRRSPSPSPGTAIPSHARLHAVGSGIVAAMPNTIAAGMPVVLLIDGDVGKSLGRVICNEVAPGAHVIALDGVQLKQFDYVDIGAVIELTNAVPVIIKSLLFK